MNESYDLMLNGSFEEITYNDTMKYKSNSIKDINNNINDLEYDINYINMEINKNITLIENMTCIIDNLNNNNKYIMINNIDNELFNLFKYNIKYSNY